jgi:L-threonylcarbamoyladenylate synthase
VLIVTVDPRQPDAHSLGRAASIIRNGGLVAFPTDTVYGIAADPASEEAVERLYAAKGRAAGIAVPLIAGTIDQALAAGLFAEADERLARAFWPGPLSIVVPASGRIAARLRGEDGTVAVRVPDHAVARALALEFGGAITATSANLSGSPPAVDGREAAAALDGRVDATVDAGSSPGGPPSTIVRLTSDGPRLLRAGAIAWERVLEFLP